MSHGTKILWPRAPFGGPLHCCRTGQYLHVFPQQNVVIVQFGEKLAGDADTCEAMLVHRLIADQVNLN